MDATRVSLARVIELGIQIGWRAAASVLCEALSQARAAGGTSEECPAATACLLTRGGEVVLLGEAGRARPDAVLGLGADLLAACPDPDDLGTAMRTGNALDFLHAFGERTSAKQRRAEIASVALRGLAAEADLSLASSEPLHDASDEWSGDAGATPLSVPASPWRTTDRAEFDGMRHRESASGALPSRAPAAVLAVTALAGILVMGVWLWPAASAGPTPPAVNTGREVAPASPPPASDPRRIDLDPTPQTATAPAAMPTVSIPGSAPIEPMLPSDPVDSPVVARPAPTGRPPRETAATEFGGPASRPSTPPLENAVATNDDPIFPAASPGVEPPALRSPVPDGVRVLWADSPAGEPTLELLVDRDGRVEDVRISSVPPGADAGRYRNLLAAGRRWQFDPARRDGVAVRCTVLVAIAR